MLKISVDLARHSVTGGISLPRPLSAVMREGGSFDWAGLARIRMIQDDLLGVDTPREDPEELMSLLIGLQTGLLYAAVSGLRLREEGPGGDPSGLDRLCRTVELVGADEHVETLAFWDGSVTLKQALGAADVGGLTHFVLIRGPSRALPRMSVMVRRGDADLALEQITRLRSLRADPPLLETAPDPQEEEALLARNALLLEAARSRRRRTPNRRRMRPRLGASEAGWERPFLPVLSRGAALPPPALELDRMAVELCDALRLATPPELARKKLLRVLNRAWRLGENPDQVGEGRSRNPQPRIMDFFRDRARAVEALTRDEASGQQLRALTRISALQAWRFGAVHPRRTPVPPSPRFREERPVAARPVPPEALDALLAAHETGEAPPDGPRSVLARYGLIGDAEGSPLTEAGLDLARLLTSPPNGELPSLLDLLEPTPEAIRALEPEDRTVRMGRPPRTGKPPRRPKSAPPASRDPDPALWAPLVERAETIAEARVQGDTDPMPELLSDLLGRAWRAGRDRRSGLPEGGHVRLPGPIRPFLEERAELIAAATLPDRKSGKRSKALKLIRASALEAWRIGSGPDPDAAPPPRYLEESPAALRGLSAAAREALLALAQDEGGPIGKRARNALSRAGLLSGEGAPRLTPEGEAAARSERDHRSSGLPSITGGTSRRRARPE